MLNKAAQEKLLKALKIPQVKITEVMADGEHDIEVPVIHIYTEAELADLKKNVKDGANESVFEVWGKQVNETHKLGLSTTDAKNTEKVIAAMQAKAVKDAGIAPDDKVKELTESLTKLQDTIKAKEAEAQTWQSKLKDREINDKYRSLLPADRNPALDDEEWVMRLKKHYDIQEKDGIDIVIDRSTGKPVKDSLENHRLPKDVITEKFTATPEWQKPKATTTEPVPAKTTHNPAKNTPGNKKYKDADAVMKEVDKRYPKDSREKGVTQLRKQYFNELMAQTA